MKNLTKENFWNQLQELHPKGMKVFCNWIDEYKAKNNWNDLFGNDQISQRKHHWADIKFHHIPLAFQIGIWIEFVCDRGGCYWEIEDMFSMDWEKEILSFIKMIDSEEN